MVKQMPSRSSRDNHFIIIRGKTRINFDVGLLFAYINLDL